MRNTLVCAAVALALSQGSALAQSGEITIWSWNIAASSLKETIAGFNKKHPDIKVNVQDLGNQQVFDKTRPVARRVEPDCPTSSRSKTRKPRSSGTSFPTASPT